MHNIKVLFRVDVDDKNLYYIQDVYDRADYELMVRRVVYALDAVRKMLIRGIKCNGEMKHHDNNNS